MDVTLRVFVSLACGAVIGAALGLGLGLTWVHLVETSSVEGYSSMLVFFGFAPIGALVGCIVGGFTHGMHLLKDQHTRDTVSERTQ